MLLHQSKYLRRDFFVLFVSKDYVNSEEFFLPNRDGRRIRTYNRQPVCQHSMCFDFFRGHKSHTSRIFVLPLCLLSSSNLAAQNLANKRFNEALRLIYEQTLPLFSSMTAP